MRFTLAACLAALTAVASANTIEFINQDDTTRTIYFTANAGLATIEQITLGGNENKTVSFPKGWIGNWFSVNKGLDIVPGMLGEIAWDGFSGSHFFDVSAIVNPLDHNGVKMLYPKESKKPMSGCQTFPCSNAYNLPDDIQTLSTTESDLVCLVGNKKSSSKRAHPRHFVTGHHSK